MKRLLLVILLWWILIDTQTQIIKIGPFDNKEACEQVRKDLRYKNAELLKFKLTGRIWVLPCKFREDWAA